ncbi:MAG TPA: molybdenum cofactor guanylyltransferase MobA [Noviherbaspirillum sp.]|uniref:molybdenum cofactor guanylyltransferase MobA n=1 Tax=Noviherbaspirillum sp. TaxID=1926288 RepID=UPI002B484331|nr:molybdenum cofactor guanylyltransferase MobA [Noviherbaspirillum sp.]HJV87012.1 molybdenum cofactor guanylyltransferase MobA [Noviherbaspirillum sp.]
MTITGMILAGGRGSRMGGVDKGLQAFRGEPMVAHVMRRLAPQVSTLAINANQNLDVYHRFGLPVWPDRMEEFPGPLAGLQTGLAHCETPLLVTAPCDSPFLPMDLVARLRDALHSESADIAYAETGEGESRQAHPVFCLLKAALLPSLSDYLESGERKMGKWFARLRAVKVHFLDEEAFRNINTLEELHKLETP